MTTLESPTYLTAWAGPLTFAEIHADLEAYAYGTLRPVCRLYAHEQLREAVQNGFIALYTTLQDTPDFLATHTRKSAVYFMAARCGSSHIKQRSRRAAEQLAIEDLWQHPAELHLISGLETTPGDPHAAFAARVDFQVDFARVMQRLANRYADSVPHLIALYACTTQVTVQNAASLLQNYRGGGWTGFHALYATVQREVRSALAEVFHQQPPDGFWDTPIRPLHQTARPAITTPSLSRLEKAVYRTLTQQHSLQQQPLSARAIVETLGSVSLNAVRDTLLRLEKRGMVSKAIAIHQTFLWTPILTGAETIPPPALPKLGQRHHRIYHTLLTLARAPHISLETLHAALPDYALSTLRRSLRELEMHDWVRRIGFSSSTQGWIAIPHPAPLLDIHTLDLPQAA